MYYYVSENDIRQVILDLNSKEHDTFENIHTKMLKISSGVCNVILQNIWNSEILEKQYFLDNLKLADIISLYKTRYDFSRKL